MKEFTSSDLKRHTGVVINEVFTTGTATVKHRDRGVIVMLTMTELGNIIANAIKESRQTPEPEASVDKGLK